MGYQYLDVNILEHIVADTDVLRCAQDLGFLANAEPCIACVTMCSEASPVQLHPLDH